MLPRPTKGQIYCHLTSTLQRRGNSEAPGLSVCNSVQRTQNTVINRSLDDAGTISRLPTILRFRQGTPTATNAGRQAVQNACTLPGQSRRLAHPGRSSGVIRRHTISRRSKHLAG